MSHRRLYRLYVRIKKVSRMKYALNFVFIYDCALISCFWLIQIFRDNSSTHYHIVRRQIPAKTLAGVYFKYFLLFALLAPYSPFCALTYWLSLYLALRRLAPYQYSCTDDNTICHRVRRICAAPMFDRQICKSVGYRFVRHYYIRRSGIASILLDIPRLLNMRNSPPEQRTITDFRDCSR